MKQVKTFSELTNAKAISLKYFCASNDKNARIRLTDESNNEYKIFNYCFQTKNIELQSFRILKDGGFDIVGRCRNREEDFLLVKQSEKLSVLNLI